MDAVWYASEDPLEIVERECNEDEYFQVLGCPELEHSEQNEHQDGDATSETTRSYLASGTNMELIDNKITESDDSGSVVYDRTGIDVLTKIQKSAAPEEFKYNSRSSPSLPQPSSAAADLLRNKISKKKNGQSTSSSLILGKTESGRNLKKVSISSSPLEVPRSEAEDNEHQDGAAIRKTSRSHLESGTDKEFTNSNTTQSDDSGSVLSHREDTNTAKELSSCTRPMVVMTGLKESDVSDEFKSNHKKSSPQPSSDADNIKHRLRNKSSKKKCGQSTSARITLGETGSGNSKKVSISRPPLKVHQRKNHKCYFCEKEFPGSLHLENHTRLHTRERPLKCSSCRKTFRRLRNVRRHKKIHTGERPFKCSICEKDFLQFSRLKSHKRIHTGERPFTCSICGKAFSDLGNAKRHEKIHSGEKPFKCSFCLKSFAEMSVLKEHVRMHTGERPFKCSICAKAFVRGSNLKEHERIHTGKKPFTCSICAKAFFFHVKFKSA